MLSINNQRKLRAVIKESVKEALEDELIKMRLIFFPEVSEKEMRDITDRYGKPEKQSVHAEKIDI